MCVPPSFLRLQLYTEYIKHHRENVRSLATKRAGSKDLEFFVQLNELSTGRSFQGLLSSPANRLASYLTFLGDIYSKIPHDTEWAVSRTRMICRAPSEWLDCLYCIAMTHFLLFCLFVCFSPLSSCFSASTSRRFVASRA